MQRLESVDASGASQVHLENEVQADTLALSLSGASQADGRIRTQSGRFDIAGASGARLSGSVGSLRLTLGGASALEARDLRVVTLDADLSGASRADLTVTGSTAAG